MKWDVDKSIAHLVENAEESSVGYCAKYVREALNEGGVTLFRPLPPPGSNEPSAWQYGESLLKAGFKLVHDSIGKEQCMLYKPVRGDVIIFPKTTESPHGHMQMFSGVVWISDFVQKHDRQGLFPNAGRRAADAPFQVFRNERQQIINYTPMRMPWE